MLACQQTFLCNGVARGFRCRRTSNGVDVLVLEKRPIIGRGGDRLCLLRNFFHPLFLDLGNVQFTDVGTRSARLRAYATTPSSSDNSNVHFVHGFPPVKVVPDGASSISIRCSS